MLAEIRCKKLGAYNLKNLIEINKPMRNLIILTFLLLFVAVKSEGQVRITFNSSKEIRQFAKLSDTLNIEFIPSTKSKSTRYRFHNLSITYEGISKMKDRLVHTDTLISDTASLKNPMIKIPLRSYVKNIVDYGMKVYINIESIDIITNGKSEALNIPKSELHREFTCTNN
jgi:hypothetical protein